jgi:HEXXH motif-containing protein
VAPEDFPDLRPVMLDPVSPQTTARIGAALELLRAQNAGYHGWVARAFRTLFVVASPAGRLVSGSLADKPRFGYVSDTERVAGTAEMLIHEASHQHFHLAAKIGPVTTDDDGEARFYSPFVRTLRPLSRLLLAYHAFANVCSFYAREIAGGIDDAGSCEQSLASLRPDVELVERTIDENAALLTPLGAGLFEPLKERLSDARALAVH